MIIKPNGKRKTSPSLSYFTMSRSAEFLAYALRPRALHVGTTDFRKIRVGLDNQFPGTFIINTLKQIPWKIKNKPLIPCELVWDEKNLVGVVPA